jgi:hypothetical protein
VLFRSLITRLKEAGISTATQMGEVVASSQPSVFVV